MITITRKDQLYHSESHWLSAYWHFSFDQYVDPNNVGFGPLRVFNDDTVRPSSGFPVHGHQDMEIVTLVLSGKLEHEDNQGNRGLLRAGDVQVMSAGWGIGHAERNPSPDEPLHLFQVWFLPRTRRHPPRWEQRAFPAADRRGRLLPVISDGTLPETLVVDQGVTVFMASLTGSAFALAGRGAPGLSCGDRGRVDIERPSDGRGRRGTGHRGVGAFTQSLRPRRTRPP